MASTFINLPAEEVVVKGQDTVLGSLDQVVEALDQIRDKLDGPCFRVADETLSALKALRAVSATNVALGTDGGTCEDATIIGISRNAGNVGESIEIISNDKIQDSSFNFPVGAQLFLGANGAITDIVPTTGFLTRIGSSGGPGLIYINIEDPIML